MFKEEARIGSIRFGLVQLGLVEFGRARQFKQSLLENSLG